MWRRMALTTAISRGLSHRDEELRAVAPVELAMESSPAFVCWMAVFSSELTAVDRLACA